MALAAFSGCHWWLVHQCDQAMLQSDKPFLGWMPAAPLRSNCMRAAQSSRPRLLRRQGSGGVWEWRRHPIPLPVIRRSRKIPRSGSAVRSPTDPSGSPSPVIASPRPDPVSPFQNPVSPRQDRGSARPKTVSARQETTSARPETPSARPETTSARQENVFGKPLSGTRCQLAARQTVRRSTSRPPVGKPPVAPA